MTNYTFNESIIEYGTPIVINDFNAIQQYAQNFDSLLNRIVFFLFIVWVILWIIPRKYSIYNKIQYFYINIMGLFFVYYGYKYLSFNHPFILQYAMNHKSIIWIIIILIYIVLFYWRRKDIIEWFKEVYSRIYRL